MHGLTPNSGIALMNPGCQCVNSCIKKGSAQFGPMLAAKATCWLEAHGMQITVPTTPTFQ